MPLQFLRPGWAPHSAVLLDSSTLALPRPRHMSSLLPRLEQVHCPGLLQEVLMGQVQGAREKVLGSRQNPQDGQEGMLEDNQQGDPWEVHQSPSEVFFC